MSRSSLRRQSDSVSFGPADGALKCRGLPRIELRGNDHFARKTRDASVAYPHHDDSVMAPVGAVFMLMSVKSPVHAERLSEPIDGGKTLAVA